jgi:FolB domain-containing protein
MDKLRLNGIEVLCIIGDLPDERIREQRLMVDVELSLDLSTSANSDDLLDTVDYAELSNKIRKVLQDAKCRLIERAASLVCNVCLEEEKVAKAAVSICKAGCVPGLASAEVRMERSNQGK